MADYKELLRRAISALPENNGAARRAVYEKARSALVGQLRAISPPLPARDITQHRLQLEDCIRQVEQEASEAVISLGRDSILNPKPSEPVGRPAMPPEQAPFVPPIQRAEPQRSKSATAPVAPMPVVPVAAAPTASTAAVSTSRVETPKIEALKPASPSVDLPASPKTEASKTDGQLSIEEIISHAADAGGTSVQAVVANTDHKGESVVLPRVMSPVGAESIPLKGPNFTPRRESGFAKSSALAVTQPVQAPAEAVLGLAPQMRSESQRAPTLQPVEPALSSVREVEVEADDAREAEGAIERAIETLDREARGEPSETLPKPSGTTIDPTDMPLGAPRTDDSGFATVDAQPKSGAGLTIFLVVFAILLVGVGSAGFWAWREGYVDLDQMFGQAQPVTDVADAPAVPTTPTLDGPAPVETGDGADPVSGPGNTATTTSSEPATALEGLEIEDRLEPTPEPVTPNGGETVLPSINGGETKTEERLSGEDTSIAAADDPAASVDPAVLAGSQSLLLEASADGRTGAVPFSGTVDWSEGVDEIGLPTLVAEASIPARNLGVSVTIRKNSDPSLPASHLMEVDFDVTDTFIGGSISSLPGVLLKDEELVPGTPLVGASARVVGNSFLFALSASPDDTSTNTQLLEARRWLDLAVVYGTGRNAILTLEKDEEAQVLFERVFGAWSE